jgi:biotin carboxylase
VSQTVLIIEPESSGLDLIRAANALGYSVVIFETRPLAELSATARDAVAAGSATYQQVDVPSHTATIAAARQLATTTDLVAVIPGFELGVPAAAAVATALGLPGVDTADGEALRDKRLMNKVLRAAGVPVSRDAAFDARTADDEKLDEIERIVGYPAVLKPVNGSGSLFVRRVDDRAALRKYVDEARGNIMEALGRTIGGELLAESYVSGPEFSVEGYAQDGEVVVLSVTGKRLGPEPNFVEIGHTVEPDLSAADRSALAATTADAVRALRITVGVFHAELRLSPSGPVVIEVGARLAGDFIPFLIGAVHGVDLTTVDIEVSAGRHVSVQSPPANGVAAVRFFIVEEPSVLVDRERLHEQLAGLPGFRNLVWMFDADATLQPATNFSQRFARLAIVAPDREQLETTLAEADRLVTAALKPASS